MLSGWEEEEQLGPGAEQEALADVRARRGESWYITWSDLARTRSCSCAAGGTQISTACAGVLGVMQQWEGLLGQGDP